MDLATIKVKITKPSELQNSSPLFSERGSFGVNSIDRFGSDSVLPLEDELIMTGSAYEQQEITLNPAAIERAK